MIIAYFITLISVLAGCLLFYVDWIYGIIVILLALIYFQLAKLNNHIHHNKSSINHT